MSRGGPHGIDIRELARLYRDEQLSLRQIQERTGVPINRASQLLRDAGVVLRKRGSRPQERLDGQRLRRAYEAGSSLRDLAIAERTDDGAVRDALLRAGAVIRASGGHHKWAHVMTAERLNAEYVERRRSARDIAAELGCRPETVLKALRQHGIPVRPR